MMHYTIYFLYSPSRYAVNACKNGDTINITLKAVAHALPHIGTSASI